MHGWRVLTVCLVVVGTAYVPVTVLNAQEQARASLQDLGWLAGYWVQDRENIRMEECWLEPMGGLMVGMHRDVKASGHVFYEYLRIEERADGIYYVAKPSNQAEASFRLVGLEAGRQVVFENKAHDFPQRIVYFLEPDGSLRANIEGVNDDRNVVSVWRMDPMPLDHAP